MISRLSQMWLPLVMTSTPASYRLRAVEIVRPMPPARFSPLAVTRSMPRASRSVGRCLLEGHPAGLADDIADHQDPQGAAAGTLRDEWQQVGREGACDRAPRPMATTSRTPAVRAGP